MFSALSCMHAVAQKRIISCCCRFSSTVNAGIPRPLNGGRENQTTCSRKHSSNKDHSVSCRICEICVGTSRACDNPSVLAQRQQQKRQATAASANWHQPKERL